LQHTSTRKSAPTRNWTANQEKHIPEYVIQSLTQRVQNRNGSNERNPIQRRLALSLLKHALLSFYFLVLKSRIMQIKNYVSNNI